VLAKYRHFIIIPSYCCFSSGFHGNAVFISNRNKLEKTFEALEQVLDNFTAKVYAPLLLIC